MKDFGDPARGRVCDEHDWGGYNPRMIRPPRVAVGTVCRIFPKAPNVVGIETAAGERLVIRTDKQR